MPTASIVICTHNRVRELEITLEAVLAQAAPAGVEVLVIDNGSTDATSELVAGLTGRPGSLLRLAKVPAPSLSNARNHGVAATRGEVVVFLDDDATVAPGWLDALLTGFADPAVGAAGGPLELAFTSPPPAWVKPHHLPYLAGWDRGPEPHRLVYNEFPRGANLALRRSALDAVGAFSPWLGRRGKSLLSCEEIELCLRIDRAGWEVRYLPGAKVIHRVAAGRLTVDWMRERFFWQGRSEARLEWMHEGWPGLRAGIARTRTSRANARGTELGELIAHTLRGYLVGAIESPLRVPRYRPRRRSPQVGG